MPGARTGHRNRRARRGRPPAIRSGPAGRWRAAGSQAGRTAATPGACSRTERAAVRTGTRGHTGASAASARSNQPVCPAVPPPGGRAAARRSWTARIGSPGEGPVSAPLPGLAEQAPASRDTTATAAGSMRRARRGADRLTPFRRRAASPGLGSGASPRNLGRCRTGARCSPGSALSPYCLVRLPGSAHAGLGAGVFAPVGRQLHHDLVCGHVVPGDHPGPSGVSTSSPTRGALAWKSW